jgi:hypothetical protein
MKSRTYIYLNNNVNKNNNSGGLQYKLVGIKMSLDLGCRCKLCGKPIYFSSSYQPK